MASRVAPRLVLPALIAAGSLACAPAYGVDTFLFTLGSTSSLTADFSATAPFTGSFIGNYDAQSNPTGTRTLLGAIGLCGPGNQTVPISGTGMTSGNNMTHPTGAFTLTLDVPGHQAILEGAALNLLGPDMPTVATGGTLNYQAFHTCQPTGFFPSISVPLDLGDGTINTLTLSQTCAPNAGTLVPTANPNQYTFEIPTVFTLAGSFTFNGAMQMIEPQTSPVMLTGTVTVSGSSATIAAAINIMQHQELTDPIPALQNAPFDLPNPLGGTVHLLLTLTLTSTTVDVNVTGNLAATGVSASRPCRADWNHDGTINSQDFFDFITSFFSGGADINCSGGTDSQDFFDFLTAFFTGC